MSLLTLLPTPAAGASGLPLLLSPRPTLNAADIAAIAAAVWAEVLEGTLTAAQMQRIKLAIARNKMVTDPVAGTVTLYDTDDTTPLYTANLFEDAAGTQPYRGQGAERRERLA